MTTGGEGGLLTTNDPDAWARAWAFKDHGKSYEGVYNREHPSGFRWLHESFGTNWRLTEMQSSLGRVLLKKLPDMVSKRRRLATVLTERFAKLPALRVTVPPAETGHSYYKYYAFLRPERLRDNWSRQQIIDATNAEGIPCYSGSCSEIYLEKAFSDAVVPTQRLPVARELGETALMFLVHPTLSEDDMHDTADAVAKVLAFASR